MASRTDSLQQMKIALIGCGRMGEVILAGMLGGGLSSKDAITVSDISQERLGNIKDTYGVSVTESNVEAAARADLIILAVKPQVMDEVLSELGEVIVSKQLIFSIAAGIRTSQIESLLTAGLPVVRIMPNTPCLVREGACAIAPGTHAGDYELDLAEDLFSKLGTVVRVKEELMDGVTGLSGSGPAFIFMLIEAMADGGVLSGLDRETALRLAAQTVKGAAEMVLSEDMHPGQLKDMVTSPAGTTAEGVRILEKQGIRGALIDAVFGAAQRSAELGQKD